MDGEHGAGVGSRFHGCAKGVTRAVSRDAGEPPETFAETSKAAEEGGVSFEKVVVERAFFHPSRSVWACRESAAARFAARRTSSRAFPPRSSSACTLSVKTEMATARHTDSQRTHVTVTTRLLLSSSCTVIHEEKKTSGLA